jgi:hypothetical protein
MISTNSHDLEASNDLNTQKWVGRLTTDNKKPIKRLIRVLYGFPSHCKKSLYNKVIISYSSYKIKRW